MARHIPDKLKNIFTDTLWSIAGLALMNVASQFVVYPYWNRILGTEAYGNVVYLIAVMNVLAISVGSGVNYTRMRQSVDGKTSNKPYNLLMIGGNVASILILLLLNKRGVLLIETTEFILFCILTVTTMWRYYADVEFRLNVNYKGFFLFYLVIGVGYLVGTLLFKITGLWPFALLLGEIAGLLLVGWKGNIFQRDRQPSIINKADSFNKILHISFMMTCLNVLSHLILNGDRIILRLSVCGTAVSIYYIASLFGKTMTLMTTPFNGVLVGHLAKYNGKLTKKTMHQITGATIATVTLAIIVCVVISVIMLPILYPAEFEVVRGYLIMATAAQVIYFVGNVITTSIIFRFTSLKNQVIINIAHAVLFVTMCIPATIYYMMDGFCISILVVNTLRLILSLELGYKSIGKGV